MLRAKNDEKSLTNMVFLLLHFNLIKEECSKFVDKYKTNVQAA